jgi:hypothetical protein
LTIQEYFEALYKKLKKHNDDDFDIDADINSTEDLNFSTLSLE